MEISSLNLAGMILHDPLHSERTYCLRPVVSNKLRRTFTSRLLADFLPSSCGYKTPSSEAHLSLSSLHREVAGHGLTVKWYFVRCSNPIQSLELSSLAQNQPLIIHSFAKWNANFGTGTSLFNLGSCQRYTVFKRTFQNVEVWGYAYPCTSSFNTRGQKARESL